MLLTFCFAQPWSPRPSRVLDGSAGVLSHPSFHGGRQQDLQPQPHPPSHRPSDAIEMLAALQLSNVTVVWPTGSTLQADELSVYVPRDPAHRRRASNQSSAAAAPVGSRTGGGAPVGSSRGAPVGSTSGGGGGARPLVIGQGSLHPKDFRSRSDCLQACKPPEPGVQGLCGSHACLCFQCRHDAYKVCQRCYGMPPNCAAQLDRSKRCIDESATWSYRATLEQEGCCSTVTDPNGPTTTMQVSNIETWRELV